MSETQQTGRSPSCSISTNRDAALAQLKALGYQQGDAVHLRFFFPDGDLRSADDKGRKSRGIYPNVPWKQIETYQREGRNAYFVVNGGGDTDKEVKQGRAIFCEWDDLDKDVQRTLWESLELPQPTMQVDTGGKSIHTYWRTECSVEEWRALQVDLLEYTNSDRTLKNPSRVMRLAGAWYIKPTEQPVQTAIIQSSGQRYSYETLRRAIPKVKPEPKEEYRGADTGNMPLETCLSLEHRDLIQRGSPQGDRNKSGFSLACDLIGTAKYLDWIARPYWGSPRHLFDQYCDRCSPSLGKEAETIWRSAERSNPSPCLSPEKIENCIQGWLSRQKNTAQTNGHHKNSDTGANGSTQQTATNKSDDNSWEQFTAEVESLLELDDLDQLQFFKAKIAAKYRVKTTLIDSKLRKIRLAKSPEEEEKTCYDVADFLNLEDSGLDWIVPGMLPKGETILLSAKPKVGKTLLSDDLAFAVATAEDDFLGQKVAQGKVLLVSVDETRTSTRLKLERRGFTVNDRGKLQVMTKFHITDLPRLEKKLAEFRPTLVIIDSLRRINAGRDISENSAEFADSLAELADLMHLYGAAGIIIHHDNKNNDAEGIDKIRGSSSIAAATWGSWHLERIPKEVKDKSQGSKKTKMVIDPKDPNRAFVVLPRDAEGQSLKIELDSEKLHWISHGEIDASEEEVANNQTMEQTIQNALAEVYPKGLEGVELKSFFPQYGRSIYAALDRLVAKKIISRRRSEADARKWAYVLPSSPQTDTPPQTHVEKGYSVLTKSPQPKSQQGIDNSQQISQQVPKISQQLVNKTPISQQEKGMLTNLLTNENPDGARDTDIWEQGDADSLGGVSVNDLDDDDFEDLPSES